jgi:hypothetical protein
MRAVVLINGAVAMGSAIAGLFFLQFWTRTRDRLFVFFALAFWILGLDWVAIGVLALPGEITYSLYLPRLLAFVLIIAAIVDKNRSRL